MSRPFWLLRYSALLESGSEALELQIQAGSVSCHLILGTGISAKSDLDPKEPYPLRPNKTGDSASHMNGAMIKSG